MPPSPSHDSSSILMVCLGNICRSPMAEAVFAHIVNERGLSSKITVDSCGTGGYHIGEEPDDRTTAVCKKHGVPVKSVCRQLQESDFHDFDYILGMDKQNIENIKRVQPTRSKAKVALFGSFGDGRVIVDPYYGGASGFEKTYQQCVEYSEGLLAELGYPKGGKL